MEREAFLYFKAKLLNSNIANRKNFGSGEVHFNLTGTYMNDPFLDDPFLDLPRVLSSIQPDAARRTTAAALIRQLLRQQQLKQFKKKSRSKPDRVFRQSQVF